MSLYSRFKAVVLFCGLTLIRLQFALRVHTYHILNSRYRELCGIGHNVMKYNEIETLSALCHQSSSLPPQKIDADLVASPTTSPRSIYRSLHPQHRRCWRIYNNLPSTIVVSSPRRPSY